MVIYPSKFFQGNEKCFLLIHGYTGSPYEMIYIAENVNEKLGWTVNVPRLPGHSTFSEDFMSTGKEDWKRRVFDEFLDLSASCSDVVVGGLSMGGILAVMTAVKFDVPRVVLYAPAFLTVFQKYIPFLFLASVFKNRSLKKDSEFHEEDPIKRKLWEEYWRYNFYRQAVEFFRLQFEGRRILKDFKGEALIVVSKSDGTVPIAVKDYLEKNLGGRKHFVVLERSPHVVTVGEEKETVLEKTLEFLGR